MDTVDVAVIGLGVMGRQHLRVLQESPGFRVVAASDPNQEAASRVSRQCPEVRIVSDFASLLEVGIDAAIVASPSALHAEQAVFLMENGIHVLLEKPVTATVAQARRLFEVARRSSTQLLVGQIERFNPAVQKLRSLIARGDIGKVMSLSASRVGVARPAVPTSNVIFDLAIHDIDIMRFLLGSPVLFVGATGGSRPGNLLEDYANVLLKCGDATGAIEANWITPRKRRKLFVTGTEGFAELDYIRQELQVFQGESEIVGDGSDLYHCVSRTADPVTVVVQQGEPLEAELRHFGACIRGEDEPAILLEEAIDALSCCDEATRYIREEHSDA